MEPEALDDLYQETILEHSRHPHNRDKIAQPDVAASAVNPFCGDEVDVQLAMRAGRVTRVGGQGKGCAISQASLSMLTEVVVGKTLEQAGAAIRAFEGMMAGKELDDGQRAALGDALVLAGVRSFPVRIKCARLAWTALSDALRQR